MSTIDPRSVIIPQDRQRKELGDRTSLGESIDRYDTLLQPIKVRSYDNVLVIGERRLRTALERGYTQIECTFTDERDPIKLHLMELEENVQRKDLTPEEKNAATVKYYHLRLQQDPTLTMEEVGAEIGLGRAAMSQHLTGEKMKDHPEVKKADGFNTMYRAAVRIIRRKTADEMVGLGGLLNKHIHSDSIIVGDFREWATAYDEPKFNFIHCDFPYGINAHKSEGQNAALPVTYNDTSEVFWQLCQVLRDNLDRICAPSAHMIFWFSPKFYCVTQQFLTSLPGFVFEEHPLIWQRGLNEGIAPDPQRRPRRVYDMAFFGWRGDRMLVNTKANCIEVPTTRESHPHEKAQEALEHFFAMVVDPNTRLLDPTCGSGSALRAALKLGAARVLGIEKDAGFADDARRELAKLERELGL